VVTEFSAGISFGAGLGSITAGPDGNLWFTESGNRIGQITPAGVVTEFSTGITASPVRITAGPDGNLWFTEYYGQRIGRITPQGVITEFSDGIGADAAPVAITAGPDGNLWFTEAGGVNNSSNRIGRITPQGVITEFSDGISPGVTPNGITAGPDGNLWFTESWGNRIGRITPTGVVTEFSAGISPGASPVGITTGPDGNLWFTEYDGNRIGRLCMACPPPAITTVVSSVNPSHVGQAITFTASVAGNFATGTVQFMDGGAPLGSPVTLSGGGVAQFITSTLTRGTHAITAVYSGDDNNSASTSSVLLQKVKRWNH